MHSSNSSWRVLGTAGLAAAVFVAAFSPLIASAQTDQTQAGPPVARLSVIEGDVSIRRGDSSDTVAATLNAPLMQNDYLSTGPTARGEVQFDGDSTVRLDNSAQLRLINLDPAHREAQLAEGDVDVRVFHNIDGAVQIDTPSVSVRPEDAGSIRVGVTTDGQTRITVRSGRAQIFWQNGSQDLGPGSTLAASGSPENPQLTSIATLGYDEFDTFNRTRDGNFNVAFQDPNVSDQIPGTGDLSQYGQWQEDPAYGQVWTPNTTAPDWAPYTDGNWVWQPTYGYTWVSAEPWGWAPYHYGRWYYNTSWQRWAWSPPPVAFAPPVYEPALVGFVTFGPGGGFDAGVGYGGVSLAFGNIGWVPLAPHEIYHPWWGGGYQRAANIRNVEIGRVYRNAYAPRGFVGVSAQQFAGGNVYRHTQALSPAAVRGATILRGPVPFAPSAANLRYTRTAASAPVRSALFENRTFAGNRPGAVASFEAQRAQASREIQSAAQRPETRTLPPESALRSTATVPEASRSFAATERIPSSTATLRQAAPSDAWSRFSTARGAAPESAGGSTAPQYRQNTEAWRSQAPSYARPATAGTGYRSPAAGSSYQRPSATYQRPAASYQRPSATYQRPSATYQRPSASYQRPSATYNRPAAAASRPSAQRSAPRAQPQDNRRQ